MGRGFSYESTNTTNVGVYGTLKRGFHNHDVLGNSPLIDDGWIRGLSLYDLGPFPGARRATYESLIYVEVYAVSPSTLQALDELEGFLPNQPESSLYIRELLFLESGPSCWVYLYNQSIEGAQAIVEGVWPN
ncbi:gamma-glutamylcyclotransferase family protein [uncultured Spongiibacter sp.]|uniref:gamma-glutamylcyclotransferase family protein n=1 Tax=uncultured Spongiibacter sp. TaxID=870896 RepID=UPI002596B9EC|nr:gamma-glutamylcyclotransferase family protein [uncultured Spongiibacter sp.]